MGHSVDVFKGGKILLYGNGGSALMYIAAELSGRFYKERKPLFMLSLHVNTSFVTAYGLMTMDMTIFIQGW